MASCGGGGVMKPINAVVSKTEEDAMKREEAQMKYWLAKGKSIGAVIKMLNGKTAGLTRSLLTYVKSFNLAYPDKKSSLSRVLVTMFDDDANVSRLVEATLKVDRFSIIARKVQAEQFERWMANNLSLTDVFGLLDLYRAGDRLLENPLMNTFAKYTNAVNQKFKEDFERGFIEMGKVPVYPKYAPGTSMIATDFERALFQLWFVKEYEPAKVFEILGLGRTRDNFLASPLFITFLKFVDTYATTFPDSDVSMYQCVSDFYEASEIVNMILAGKKVPSLRYAVNRMEGALIHKWLYFSRSPDVWFEELELKTVPAAELFQSPLFLYWMNTYMGEFTKSRPGMHISRTILAIEYKDEDLINAITAAQRNPETKDVAEKFKTELFVQFIFAKKDPADVANLLHVKHKTDPDWIFWKMYEQDYHKYHDAK